MKQQFLGLSIVFMALYLLSCTVSTYKHIVAAIDISGSRDSSVIENYIKTLQREIIKNLDTKSSMSVFAIDRATLTDHEVLFSYDFSQNKYGNELAGLGEGDLIKKAHADSIIQAASRLEVTLRNGIAAREQYRNGSDILGGLSVVAQGKKQADKKVLVLFSDMLHTSGEVDFEHGLHNAEDVLTYLKEIPSINLSGWSVIVVTGSQANISKERFVLVKRFWAEYFKKCDAKLLSYSSSLNSETFNNAINE